VRTTVTLDDDVMAAVEDLRRREGTGLSDAVNRLVRAGLARQTRPEAYHHETADLGLKLDVTNIADVLELLDET
jgi:Arc/MetJ family transcription regulator